VTRFDHLIFELEDYARENGGRFWLLDIPGRSSPLPQGSLRVVVDFEQGGMQATLFVDIVCRKHRVLFSILQAADLPDEFKQAALPNALILFGPPMVSPEVAEQQIDERLQKLMGDENE
jgi:hypothetical protein